MALNKQEELRLLARRRLELHELPCEEPPQIWGGRGSGQPCALCRYPILPDECEYELEQQLHGVLRTFHFHLACESVWQLECARGDDFQPRVTDPR